MKRAVAAHPCFDYDLMFMERCSDRAVDFELLYACCMKCAVVAHPFFDYDVMPMQGRSDRAIAFEPQTSISPAAGNIARSTLSAHVSASKIF